MNVNLSATKKSSKEQTDRFMKILQLQGIQVEYYEPPGRSVGASCGEFLMDYYKKYNTKK